MCIYIYVYVCYIPHSHQLEKRKAHQVAECGQNNSHPLGFCHTYIHAYICAYIHAYIYTGLLIYVHAYICICIHIKAFVLYIYMYMHICVCMYAPSSIILSTVCPNQMYNKPIDAQTKSKYCTLIWFMTCYKN